MHLGELALQGSTAKSRHERHERKYVSILRPDHAIALDGGHVHLIQSGEGAPTVVFISGIGGFTAFWSLVQPEIARLTHAFSHDRPGYMKSDALPEDVPLTAARAANDLHLLLQCAGAKPPFILVGHSFGGFVARLYAARFPAEVAGIVMIDANHEDEWTSRYPDEHRKGLRLMERMMRLLWHLSRLGIPQLLVRLRTPTAFRGLPADAQRTAVKGFAPKTLRTISREFRALEQSAREVRHEASDLGDVPLIVIRRGQAGPVAPGVSRELAATLEQIAAQNQEELSRLSNQGELWVAKDSSHNIHVEQPQIVIDAVRKLIETVRANGAQTSEREVSGAP